MTAPFSDNEKTIIRNQLKVAAKECIQKYGIKKTTIDELTQIAGISKGAFYKFYASKELLFFDVINDFHTEFYALAKDILQNRTDLPLKERAQNAILETLMFILNSDFLRHIESELPYLLRKVPKEMLDNHSLSGDLAIKNIIVECQVPLSVSEEFVYAFMRAFETLIINQESIGKDYLETILKMLVHSFCEKIFAT